MSVGITQEAYSDPFRCFLPIAAAGGAAKKWKQTAKSGLNKPAF